MDVVEVSGWLGGVVCLEQQLLPGCCLSPGQQPAQSTTAHAQQGSRRRGCHLLGKANSSSWMLHLALNHLEK